VRELLHVRSALRRRVVRERTPFRRALDDLGLPRTSRVLDVGAGGFAGDVTTRHLVDLFDGPVAAIERDPERVAALAERFGSDVTVTEGDAFADPLGGPYDLVVVDLDSGLIPRAFERLLPTLQALELAPGGVVVLGLITDLALAYGGPRALDPAGAADMGAFLKRRFGRLRIDEDALAAGVAPLGAWTVAGLVAKYDDPLSFMSWAILRDRREPVRPAPPQRAAAPPPERRSGEGFAQEVRRRARDGQAIALDLIGDRSTCDERCEQHLATWGTWARTAFHGTLPIRGELQTAADALRLAAPDDGEYVVPSVALALIRVGGSLDEYVAGLARKPRQTLGRFERFGYVTGPLDYNAHLEDMYAINTSKPVRSGGPMTEGYLARPTPIGAATESCPRHRSLYLGAFREGRLLAYARLVLLNELAALDRIIGHADALPHGVMNGLVRELADVSVRTGFVRAINYLTLRSSTMALDRFKSSVGFAPYAAFLRVPREGS
jgi:hypothetical protein